MPPVRTADRLISVEHRRRAVTVEGRRRLPVGTAFVPMRFVVPSDEEDSFTHAAAAAAAFAAFAAANSTGGEDRGKSDSSHAHFNSALIAPVSKFLIP
jgi:hypothetical protein